MHAPVLIADSVREHDVWDFSQDADGSFVHQVEGVSVVRFLELMFGR